MNIRTVFKVASAAFFVASSAFAQSGTVTNHAIPIGKGPGVTGFGSAVPGAAGQVIISNGNSSDPSFSPTLTTPSTGQHYSNSGANIQRFSDRVFIGDATLNAGTNTASQPDWLTTWQLARGASFGYIQTSKSAILNGSNSAELESLTVGAQTLNTVTGGNAIGVASFAVNNKPSDSIAGYAFYGEGHRCATCTGGANGIEIDTVNFNSSTVTIDPYQQLTGQTIGHQIASGGEVYSGVQNDSAAINIRSNGAKFISGIIFGSTSLETSGNPNPDALALPDAYSLTWYSAASTKLWKMYTGSTNLNLTTPTSGSMVVSAPLYSYSSNVNGSAGSGFFQAGDQSVAPSTPTSALRIYSDASNRLSWKGTNGFSAALDATANTASRLYTLPDVAGTVTLNTATQTLTNKTLTSPVISGGSIDNATVGATTASTGKFTTLNATSAIQFNGSSITGAWTSYTPTLGSQSGSFTLASAAGKYMQIGKSVFYSMSVSITTNGTAAGSLTATLPSTPATNGAASGRENGVSGKMLQAQVVSGSNVSTILNYDNTYPGANGASITISGVYESQ